MSVESFLNIILYRNLQWHKVNDQPCIHTFHSSFYINLCLWKNQENKPTISIDVDDIEKGVYDILSLDIKEGDDKFTELFVKYNSAKLEANNIAA